MKKVPSIGGVGCLSTMDFCWPGLLQHDTMQWYFVGKVRNKMNFQKMLADKK